MNKEQSLELFKKGQGTWNAWAERMLAIKRNLKESGEWIEGVSDKWNSKTRAWQEEAKVDFNGHEFEADAKFDGFRFPGNARFQSTKFMGTAQFDKTEFLGITWFSGAEFFSHAGFSEATIGPCAFRSAKFRKIADFWNSTFTDDKVNFVSVKFSSNAVFDQVKFKGKADFNQMEFKGDALFEGAEFSGRAIFWKAKFSGQTNFRDVTFSRLVIFDEATFSSNVLFDQCVFENPPISAIHPLRKMPHSKQREEKVCFCTRLNLTVFQISQERILRSRRCSRVLTWTPSISEKLRRRNQISTSRRAGAL